MLTSVHLSTTPISPCQASESSNTVPTAQTTSTSHRTVPGDHENPLSTAARRSHEHSELENETFPFHHVLCSRLRQHLSEGRLVVLNSLPPPMAFEDRGGGVGSPSYFLRFTGERMIKRVWAEMLMLEREEKERVRKKRRRSRAREEKRRKRRRKKRSQWMARNRAWKREIFLKRRRFLFLSVGRSSNTLTVESALVKLPYNRSHFLNKTENWKLEIFHSSLVSRGSRLS